eukprot:Em0024g429a
MDGQGVMLRNELGVKGNGASSLGTACNSGHLDVVKTLIEAGANINQAVKFCPKGVRRQPGDRVYPSGQIWTNVALACLGCDQTCHYHDVVMVSGRRSPLTDLRPSFAQKGSGGNLVTGCTHQAKSGTKVALACLGCDQTCHYHDVVMVSGRPSPLTDLGPSSSSLYVGTALSVEGKGIKPAPTATGDGDGQNGLDDVGQECPAGAKSDTAVTSPPVAAGGAGGAAEGRGTTMGRLEGQILAYMECGNSTSSGSQLMETAECQRDRDRMYCFQKPSTAGARMIEHFPIGRDQHYWSAVWAYPERTYTFYDCWKSYSLGSARCVRARERLAVDFESTALDLPLAWHRICEYYVDVAEGGGLRKLNCSKVQHFAFLLRLHAECLAVSAQNAHIHFKQGSLSLATTSQRTKMGAVPASPIAGISIRLARRILDLAFVEMCDFLSDCWQEEAQQLLVLDPLQLVAPRRLSRKASVQDIGLWIECFSWMAAVLVSTRLQRYSHTRHPSSDVTELRGQLWRTLATKKHQNVDNTFQHCPVLSNDCSFTS